jgi:hypothetical protein
MSLQSILSATLIYGLATVFPPVGLFLGILYRFFGKRLLAPTDHVQVGNNLMVMGLLGVILYFLAGVAANVAFLFIVQMIAAQMR